MRNPETLYQLFPEIPAAESLNSQLIINIKNTT